MNTMLAGGKRVDQTALGIASSSVLVESRVKICQANFNFTFIFCVPRETSDETRKERKNSYTVYIPQIIF